MLSKDLVLNYILKKKWNAHIFFFLLDSNTPGKEKTSRVRKRDRDDCSEAHASQQGEKLTKATGGEFFKNFYMCTDKISRNLSVRFLFIHKKA